MPPLNRLAAVLLAAALVLAPGPSAQPMRAAGPPLRFLAGPGASFMNGAIVTADGGYTSQ